MRESSSVRTYELLILHLGSERTVTFEFEDEQSVKMLSSYGSLGPNIISMRMWVQSLAFAQRVKDLALP